MGENTEEKEDKLNIPYYQVAMEALMKWNGLSETEAKNVILTHSFQEIESQIHAKNSINYAIQGMQKTMMLSEKDVQELSDFIYKGEKSEILDQWKNEFEILNSSTNQDDINPQLMQKNFYNFLIINMLFNVHDGWVIDNVGKFNSREKKHQHMPSELIGWKEVKLDLLFIKPIFEIAGIYINEEELEQAYVERVDVFFRSNSIQSSEDLAKLITQGKDFYPPLAGYGEILKTISNPEYVMKNIIPAIEEQGIGKIEDVVQNFEKKNQNITNTHEKSEQEVREMRRKFGEGEKNLVFSKLQEVCLKQEKAIKTISASLEELGERRPNIPNSGITANNKFVEIYQELKDAGVDMFGEFGEARASFLGNVITIDLINQLYVSVAKLEQLSSEVEKIVEKRVDKLHEQVQLQKINTTNPIKRFVEKLKRLFSTYEEVDLSLTDEERKIITEKENNYKNYDSNIGKYNLKDNLTDSIEKYKYNREICGENEENIRMLMDDDISPSLKKLGLEKLIPEVEIKIRKLIGVPQKNSDEKRKKSFEEKMNNQNQDEIEL